MVASYNTQPFGCASPFFYFFPGVENEAGIFRLGRAGVHTSQNRSLVFSSAYNNELLALFLVGAIWMAFHAVTMLLLAWLIKAPLFFLAVGSQANVGGAASAPVVASAFHPALAPVGVLLAVLGYALGTYGGWLSGQLMRVVAPE